MAMVGALSLLGCSKIAVTDGLASDDVQLATGERTSDTSAPDTTALSEPQPTDVSFVDASDDAEAEATILTLDDELAVEETSAIDDDTTAAATTVGDTTGETETTTESVVGDGLPGDPAVVPTGTWTPANAQTIADMFRLPGDGLLRTLPFGEVVRTTGRAQSLDGVLWAEVTDNDGVVGWVGGSLLIEAPDPNLIPTATPVAAPTATPEPEATVTPEPPATATAVPDPTATPDPTIVVLRELVVTDVGPVFVSASAETISIYQEPDPGSEVVGTAEANDEMVVAANGYWYENVPYVEVTFGDVVGWTDGSFLEVR